MEKQTIEVEVKGIEEAQQKADELVKTLEKAKTLADELALKELLQVIASNKEQTSDAVLSYDPETGEGTICEI